MLKIRDAAPSRVAVVTSDDYVPFSASVSDEAIAGPLYARISGARGGELELKLDRHSGELVELVVIELPPAAQSAATIANPEAAEEDGLPRFDRAPWDLNPDLQPRRSIVEIGMPLDVVDAGSRQTIVLAAPARIARWLRWGPVRFGVAADDSLAAIEVPGQFADADRYGASSFTTRA